MSCCSLAPDKILFILFIGDSAALRYDSRMSQADKIRCHWAETNPLLTAYHDQEWGVPVHDDHRLFEMLNLEGAQAGLSWLTILNKRGNYQKAFDNFDA